MFGIDEPCVLLLHELLAVVRHGFYGAAIAAALPVVAAVSVHDVVAERGGSLEADGKTIASYDYNVDVTRKVADMAHKVGVTVESLLAE